jgi:hypothetical protein
MIRIIKRGEKPSPVKAQAPEPTKAQTNRQIEAVILGWVEEMRRKKEDEQRQFQYTAR